MIRLVTVGTGTVSPHAERTSAAHWLEAGPVRLLMDCGAGTCHRLQQFGLPWTTITHIAITHFHADHFGELPALLFAMKYGAREPRSAPITVLGPRGFGALLDKLAAAFGDWVTTPGWPLTVCELDPGRPQVLCEGVTLDSTPVPHTDESLALAVSVGGRRLVYTGDTGPSDSLADWARDCDLLLAECSLPDHLAMDIHLTPSSAGALAARAQAKRLVLTHLYPPVERVDILTTVAGKYSGPVHIARDGDLFEVAED